MSSLFTHFFQSSTYNKETLRLCLWYLLDTGQSQQCSYRFLRRILSSSNIILFLTIFGASPQNPGRHLTDEIYFIVMMNKELNVFDCNLSQYSVYRKTRMRYARISGNRSYASRKRMNTDDVKQCARLQKNKIRICIPSEL